MKFSLKMNSKYLSYVYVVVIILLGVQTFSSHFGDAPPLVVHDYWDQHGFFLLIFLAMFPRLALLLSSISSGGLLWWLGWFFSPRLLVALLATTSYLTTNPFLVVAAWFIALSGEFKEKEFVRQKSHSYFYYQQSKDYTQVEDENVIDAEFRDLH